MFGFSKKASAKAAEGPVAKVPQESLFVSEPEPWMFGNRENTPKAAGWSNANWLKSRFHFNFAEYHGGRDGFGVLRVMNDDLVQPQRGFGAHPHRDMEIITFIVEGSLTHKDSMGTEETLHRGSIQFMTAGTGVRHSEHNLDPKRPLRFIQSWVVPRSRGLRPNYGSMVGDEIAAARRRNQWAHLVADVQAGAGAAPVQINQDCNVYAAELDAGVSAPALEIKPGRQGYMLLVEGEALVGGESLSRHDAAQLGQQTLEVQAGREGALVLLFEMAASH